MSVELYINTLKDISNQLNVIKNDIYPNYKSMFTSDVHIGIEKWIRSVNDLTKEYKYRSKETLLGDTLSCIRKISRICNLIINNRYSNPAYKEQLKSIKDLVDSIIVMEKLTK